ncbi:MAG: diguanylate cyclase [Halanaerobiales bacterium]
MMGFVVLTSSHLKIKKVLYNDTSLPSLEKGRILTSLIKDRDRSKLLDLSQNIKNGKAEFGFEIHITVGEEVKLYNFSGIKESKDTFLILGSQLKEDILNQYDHFMKMNNKYVNKIRSLLKDQIITENDTVLSDESADLYNEITKVNNELMNVQRELTKTNKELERQKERYYATLRSIGEGVIALGENKEITFINETARNILNINKDIKGTFFSDNNIKILNQNGNKILENFINKVTHTSRTIKKEDLNLISNHYETPIDLTISPIEVENNRLIGLVIVITDITPKKEQEKKLRKLAATDRLTNIMNRRMGTTYLRKQIGRVKREAIDLTVCFIDVNGLKKVNDNFGHNEGDSLLKNTAQLLADNIREIDAVARFGGDEFLIIFNDCDLKEAKEIWRRIAGAIDNWNKNTEKSYEISLSYGFAQKTKNDNLNLDDLINKADERMYENKIEHYNKE